MVSRLPKSASKSQKTKSTQNSRLNQASPNNTLTSQVPELADIKVEDDDMSNFNDDDQDNDNDQLDDSRPTKRQRVSLACDCCRKKKIKCDGKTPTCTSCLNNRLDCSYTQPERKLKPKKT